MNGIATATQTWLAGLGVAGNLLTMAIPVVLYLLYRKYGGKVPDPVIPSPTPNAATTPPLLAGVAPLLNALLAARGHVPATGATTAHVSHALLVQLGNEIASVNDAHSAGHSDALVDLRPASAATSATPPPVTPVA